MSKSTYKHSHSCSHGHHHAHHSKSTSSNISIALALNMGFAIVELIGGYWSNSTAIQADAIHDFGDSAALGAALVLQLISALPPRKGYSYGLKRLSLLSAVMTSMLLIAGSGFIIFEALRRVGNPVTPHLNGMLGLAILGVIVNGFAAWKMSSGHSQNEKALSWHMIEDLMGWVAVLISSIVMRFWDCPWLDPLLAVLIGIFVVFGASRSLWTSLRLFLQAVPPGLSEEAIRDNLRSTFPELKIIDLKLWSLDGEHHICTMHVELGSHAVGEHWNKLRNLITSEMQQFGVIETTIEPTYL